MRVREPVELTPHDGGMVGGRRWKRRQIARVEDPPVVSKRFFELFDMLFLHSGNLGGFPLDTVDTRGSVYNRSIGTQPYTDPYDTSSGNLCFPRSSQVCIDDCAKGCEVGSCFSLGNLVLLV